VLQRGEPTCVTRPELIEPVSETGHQLCEHVTFRF